MRGREFEAACLAFRNGEISYEVFNYQTQFYWKVQARKLMNRHHLPCVISLEDVVQELTYRAWEYIDRYDPSYGKTFKQYIVWNAMAETQRWLNIQRNARYRSNSSESRFPINISSIVDCEETILDTEDSYSDRSDELLDVIDRIDIVIPYITEQDPKSARALMALKLNKLDIVSTCTTLTDIGDSQTINQARASLTIAAQTYL